MEAPGEWGAGVVQVSVGRSDACVPRRAVCVLSVCPGMSHRLEDPCPLGWELL